MHVDVLIAGGGIAGLLLARALRSRGRTVTVANDPARPAAASAAVGLLNPVLGQRFTLAWRAGETLPAARALYAHLARDWKEALWRDVPLLRVLRTADEHAAWEAHHGAVIAAGFDVTTNPEWPAGFKRDGREAVAITGAGVVDARRLLECLRREAIANGIHLEQPIRPADLAVREEGVTWNATGITADALVIAPGAGNELFASLAASGEVSPLPVRPVKGETLLVWAPAADGTAAFVCGHFLAPQANGTWVCGSTLAPQVDNVQPTAAGRDELELFLREMLTVPWDVIEHRAGIRPVTPDLRPVVGRWLQSAPVFVFNGLGSRGLALAPWLAEQLAAHLCEGCSLPPEILPDRFAVKPSSTGRWHAVDVARAETLLRVRPGDTVVDLTVGNGGDTLWLADAVGASGIVYGFDIQPAAITATQRRLAAHGVEATVHLVCEDHAHLRRHVSAPLAAVVANLGHLPGSASTVVTHPRSTLAAFDAACDRLRIGGVLVAVIYPGHPGGAEEHVAIASWVETLPAPSWLVRWRRDPAHARHAPIVLVLEKRT